MTARLSSAPLAPARHAKAGSAPSASTYRCPGCRLGTVGTDPSLGASARLSCDACAEEYDVREGGIPDLIRAGTHSDAVARQGEHFDEEVDPEFEIERPHGAGALYQSMMDEKFRRAFALLPVPLRGLTVLDVCCGSGMASEYYAARGAIVSGVDVSHEALLRAQTRARRRGYPFRAALSDVGNLPFEDGAFDVVAVHDGLHHVEEPCRAIDEMARVARRGVVMIEPADARVTRWAVRRGLALDVEEAGNRIYRFRPEEIGRVLSARGLGGLGAARYLMWYPHVPPRWFRWFDHPACMVMFDAVRRAADIMAGNAGNKLAVVGWRTER